MKPELLTPHLQFHDDEVGQGYFARLGYFHAGVSAGKFCRYSGLDRGDFRSGTMSFSELTAALSGTSVQSVFLNTLRQDADDTLHLRGERLGLPMVRRTFVGYCPCCLREDVEGNPTMGDGAMRLRWAWLLRPIVACPVHGVALTMIRAPDAVSAFDLGRLFAQQGIQVKEMTPTIALTSGELQTYVIKRVEGETSGPSWLDGQALWPAVKLCEMLGALIEDGPNARTSEYTEQEWARVGNIGYKTCQGGTDAILGALAALRVSAGASSGRAGPQAVYGFVYNWLKHSARAKEFGFFRDILREAIVENFATSPGEVIFGEKITERRVHSVNSLVNKTGINRYRLYRLMRKTGMIPETAEEGAFNQWVFPAEDGERLIERIENSVSQNKVQHVLGCSKTHAEQLAHHGLITSIVAISEGGVGQTQGYFNHDDLAEFMDTVLSRAKNWSAEEDGFVNLTKAAKGRSSTAEILRWHLEGKLSGTRLIAGRARLDHLRFDLALLRKLVDQSRGYGLHRLTSVALILGVNIDAVKKLIDKKAGGPWLATAPQSATRSLHGQAYVSDGELDKFQGKYLTLALIGRLTGLHYRAAQRLLEKRDIQPALDPSWLGARIYRREQVSSLLLEYDAPQMATAGCKARAENTAHLASDKPLFRENTISSESDEAHL